jgi:hypothetical protein
VVSAASYDNGLGFHATAGAEYRTEGGGGPIGSYGEAKPLLSPAILEGVPLLLFRSGVNFYF